MLLCIDIGNSNILSGVFEEEKLIRSFRYVTNEFFTEDEYFQKFQKSLEGLNIDACIIASVVPSLNKVFERMLKKHFNIKAYFVGPGTKSGIRLLIEEPKSLGADLLSDLAYAVANNTKNALIIDLGTATKILVLTNYKDFHGGIIAPGLKSSLDSLINHASLLSDAVLEEPKQVVGNSTITCLQSGSLYGTTYMLEGMVEAIKEETKVDDYTIYLTGGLATLVKDLVRFEAIYEENLILWGLKYLYEKNH